MTIGIDARMYRSSVAGIGRYSQNLIRNLFEIDSENQYVLFMTSEDQEEFKVQISKCKMKVKNYQIIQTNIPHYSIGEQIKFAKIISRESASRRIDLMHFLHFNVPINFKGKFVVTIHDLTLLFYPQAAKDINFLKHLGFRYIFKKAINRAEKIIAVSRNTKKDLLNIYKLPQDKIKVIYEAADEKMISAYAKSHLEKEIQNLKTRYALGNMPVILYVGQFRGHKNIDMLKQAFITLREKFPCKLVLAGGSGKSDYKDIILPGYISDMELAAWYKIANVYVMPSMYEGFGLPGLEAMTAGLPVVASRRASLPEIYQDAAIYFNPFSSKDISDKIKMVLEDDKLRDKLIARGKIVASKYSWEKTAKETLEVYKEISNLPN